LKNLSRSGFVRAREYLKSRARPLERALYARDFENAPVADSVLELTAFQNDDGGFGRALEPDLRTPSSSALATAIGLRRLMELSCGPHEPSVDRAVRYLLGTGEAGIWRIAPADAHSYPHAPWWHDRDGSLARTFDGFIVNPSADIVGLLHHFSSGVSEGWITRTTEALVSAIERGEARLQGDGFICAVRLAETAALPEHYRRRVVPRLRHEVLQVVSRDPQQWASYCTPPLWVAPTADSLLADTLRDDVQQHLDYLIDTQTPEGCWRPFWNWGTSYPDVWVTAREEWSGHLTLNALMCLRAYGRIG
jgi:hypothetical protein